MSKTKFSLSKTGCNWVVVPTGSISKNQSVSRQKMKNAVSASKDVSFGMSNSKICLYKLSSGHVRHSAYTRVQISSFYLLQKWWGCKSLPLVEVFKANYWSKIAILNIKMGVLLIFWDIYRVVFDS